MSVLLTNKMFPALVTPISAVSTDVGMQVISNDPNYASQTVEVSAAGDITFKAGALSAEAAANADVGATGVIAIATYATFGAAMDKINASKYYRARLVGVQRSDLFSSTGGVLITRSAAQCKNVVVSLLRDTTVILTATLYAIGVRVGRYSLLGGNDGGVRNWITRIEGIGTSAGAHTLSVYSSNPQTKVDTSIFTGTVASATAYEYNDVDFGTMGGLCSKPNEELLVQHQADTATITSPRLQVQGYHEYLGNVAPARSAAISGQ